MSVLTPRDAQRYPAQMLNTPSRIDLFGPGGYCDNCLQPAGSLSQGSGEGPCLSCGIGQFRHRSHWVRFWCPTCMGGGCDDCRRRGVIPVPRE